jgi:hypothetical protein
LWIAEKINGAIFFFVEDLQLRKGALLLNANAVSEAFKNMAWMEEELTSAGQQLDQFKSIFMKCTTLLLVIPSCPSSED